MGSHPPSGDNTHPLCFLYPSNLLILYGKTRSPGCSWMMATGHAPSIVELTYLVLQTRDVPFFLPSTFFLRCSTKIFLQTLKFSLIHWPEWTCNLQDSRHFPCNMPCWRSRTSHEETSHWIWRKLDRVPMVVPPWDGGGPARCFAPPKEQYGYMIYLILTRHYTRFFCGIDY